jgi:hypothetical protein
MIAKYRFYATLLDAYQRYLGSEQDEAFQEIIDKINRKPFESEAAAKGTAFNKLVDDYTIEKFEGKEVRFDGFKFNPDILNNFKSYFKGAASQVFTSGTIETSKGLVEVYGYADKVLQDTCFDIKTTGKYEFPKYINGWQHKVYPYCFNQNDIFIDRFEYTVTDFNRIYKEQYFYRPEVDVPAIKGICESLIDFVEMHRELITDRKIFNLPKEETSLK